MKVAYNQGKKFISNVYMESHHISKKGVIKTGTVKGTVLKCCALTYPYKTLSRKSLVRSF